MRQYPLGHLFAGPDVKPSRIWHMIAKAYDCPLTSWKDTKNITRLPAGPDYKLITCSKIGMMHKCISKIPNTIQIAGFRHILFILLTIILFFLPYDWPILYPWINMDNVQ